MTYLNHRHVPGGSCACVAWSGVFKNKGMSFNESMIFGLGSGLYFGFCGVVRQKYFDICLTSSSIVEDLLLNTNTDLVISQFTDGQRCLDIIKELLKDGSPVAVQLNPFHCEGLLRVTPKDLQQYLPKHWVLIVNCDEDNELLIAYDNRQFNPVAITFEEFLKARSTGNSEQNPHNFFYDIVIPDNVDFQTSHQIALRKTFLNFTQVKNLQSFYVGIYGMEKLYRQISQWDKILKPDQLTDTLMRVYQSTTGAGGIKGGYRNLFAEYLKKIATDFNASDLLVAATYFKESADHWNDFTKALRLFDKNDSEAGYWGSQSIFSSHLKNIVEFEKEAFSIIETYI